MDQSLVIGAIVTGLAGSVHCVGMCGPLALAVHGVQGRRMPALITYFLGKTFTYAVLGAIAGLMGQGLQQVGVVQMLSVLAGVLLLLIGLNQLLRPQWWHHNKLASHVQGFIAYLTGKVLTSAGKWSSILMGALNGLLPCGLVYLGMVGAGVSGTWYGGAMYMALMGLATIPALALFVGGMHAAGMAFRNKAQQLMPYMIVAIGVLLILRGAGLGIPFISPAFSQEAANASAVSCH